MKTLSFAGKAVLVKVVLASLPLHIISVVQPPKTIIKQIARVMPNFIVNQKVRKNIIRYLGESCAFLLTREMQVLDQFKATVMHSPPRTGGISELTFLCSRTS